MIELGGKRVKLCLLDTNILSDILKNKEPYFKTLYELFPPPEHIFCYSVFSITEIKKLKYLFNKYIDAFSVIPSLIMNGHDVLFQEELRHYQDQNHQIKAWAIAPFAIKSKLQMSNAAKLRYVLSQYDIVKKEKYWIGSAEKVLKGILSLKKNYPPKVTKYTKKEVIEFVDLVTSEQIVLRAKAFVRNELDSGRSIDINLFPSLRSTSYAVFYKFYPDRRKPRKSDVFDIIICSLLPYVDIFITEGHQNEVINKIKKIDDILDHLENKSIKEIL